MEEIKISRGLIQLYNHKTIEFKDASIHHNHRYVKYHTAFIDHGLLDLLEFPSVISPKEKETIIGNIAEWGG